MLKKEEGFTLIELIIVVAIIAILGAVVAPNILKAIDGSRVVAVVADTKVIKSAAQAYYADTGQWPESPVNNEEENKGSDPGFINNPGPDPDVVGWNGPYLDRWPEKNPWGGTYILSYMEKTLNEGEKLYLLLTQVPGSALTKLQDKLGKTIVDTIVIEEIDVVSIYLTE
jgi:general secretion pathway protein G